MMLTKNTTQCLYHSFHNDSVLFEAAANAERDSVKSAIGNVLHIVNGRITLPRKTPAEWLLPGGI